MRWVDKCSCGVNWPRDRETQALSSMRVDLHNVAFLCFLLSRVCLVSQVWCNGIFFPGKGVRRNAIVLHHACTSSISQVNFCLLVFV